MAADLTTQSQDVTGNADQPSEEDRSDDRGRGVFGTLALLVFALVAIVLVLTQCTARVPNVVGLDRKAAVARLKQSGLSLGYVSETLSSKSKTGLVDEQIPAAGVMLRTGGTVDIVLTRSTALLTVPDVTGHASASAAVELQQAGFNAEPAEEYSDTAPLDTAIEQSPHGGSSAARGSVVTVYYSIGPLSAARTSASRTSTSGGFTIAGTTGSGGDVRAFSTARAYPNAIAWSSGGDIYVRLSPGGGTRRVTSGAPWDTNPIVAPNGRYLVFMRAPSSGAHATAIGAVSFTSFATHLLTQPELSISHLPGRWVGAPVFAPTGDSAVTGSDWIVYPQYYKMAYGLEPVPKTYDARLLVCKVVSDSTWVSWNTVRFRPSGTLRLSAARRAGCIRVRQYISGKLTYARDLYLPTGVYLR